MAASDDLADAALSTAILDRIDQIADRFEAAWKTGNEPVIAEFLGSSPGPERRALLVELIRLDLDYRQRKGNPKRIDDYARDFPELLDATGRIPDHLVLHAHGRAARSADGSNRPAKPANYFSLQCPQCHNPIGQVPTENGSVTCGNCGGSFRVAPGVHPLGRQAELPCTLGKFQLLGFLGQGSFGAVYKARDAELERLVAIKIPRAGYFSQPQEQERFLREARSAAQLNHHGIVKVHEIAYQDGMPFLVSDYVEGRTLAQILTERRPGFREAAELTAQIAEALEHAHRHKIIHRDINPRNILIDANGRPHITDFGLARRDEGNIVVTLDGEILGTPAYMSPEQAAGEQSRIDGRSDVYSVGVLLYELLTGELPFRGNLRMLLRQVMDDEPRPPRGINDRIPRDLETICLKAMAKTPGQRFAAAGELAEDLRRFLSNRPIQARPVGAAERLWRWCRRNPILATLTAAVMVLLLAITIGALVTATEHEKLARLEKKARGDVERSLEQIQEALSQSQAAQGILLLEAGNTNGLLELLKARETVAKLPALQTSRSLLWSGWYPSCANRLLQVIGHEERLFLAALSPDGKTLATAGDDGTVRLWNPDTGPIAGAVFPIRLDSYCSMAFTPDSKRLAIAGSGNTMNFVDVEAARMLTEPSIQASEHISLAPISHNGRWLATVAGKIQVWNLADGKAVGPPLDPGGGPWTVRFSPNDKWLACGCHDGTVHVWDTATWQPRKFSMKHGPSEQKDIRVAAMAFSPDEKLLATASRDDTVRLWDLETGKAYDTPLNHAEDLWDVAFSPDGKLLATACYDGTAQLWDVSSGKKHGPSLRHDGPVFVLAFSPDGKRLATGSADNSARLWNTETASPHGTSFQHRGPVYWLAFTPDGSRLVISSRDGMARVWSLISTGPENVTLPHEDRVWTVAFSPDGSLLATGSQDGRAHLWNVQTGTRVGKPIQHSSHEVLSVAFDRRGQILATGGVTLQLWGVQARKPLGEPMHGRSFRALAIRPDGKIMASVCSEGEVHIWDMSSHRLLHTLKYHNKGVDTVAFSPDGRLLASGSADKTVRFWDVQQQQERGPPLVHPEGVEALAFSREGDLLATSAKDLTIRLWRIKDFKVHGQPFQHPSLVQSLAFSPDGRQLATAAFDGGVRLWDLQTWLPCGPVLWHQGMATAVTFSPDGSRLATASFDRTARIWKLPPLILDEREMKKRTTHALGARLNAQGLVEAVPSEEWQKLK